MLTTLRKLDCGCHMYNQFIGCIMYADDLLLISASVIDLQRMLNSCNSVGCELGIKFNSTKSNCIMTGPHKLSSGPPAVMFIGGSPISWVDKVKYLGIHLSAGISFEIDINEMRRKFFVAVNCIISKCKFTSDMVKLQLLESHCLPILLYAAECLNYSLMQLTLIIVGGIRFIGRFLVLINGNRYENLYVC